jgi:sugar phosphate isomerase/epimerase
MTVTGQKTEAAPREKISALRLGVRAHDFGQMPADELASRIAAQGFSCVQLALNKAVAGLDLQAGDLHGELAREIGCAFELHGVGIEVLGCYINPIHPDLKTRAALLEFFKDHLRFARDFGCGIVALESGSVNADYSPHPANHGEAAFQTMLASISALVAVAEQFGVIVGLEAVTSHTVSTPQKMRRVLDEIASDYLQVVLDPVNLLSPENFRAQSRVVAEALDLLGSDIAVVHVKDFIFENGAMQTVPAGCGQLDFAPILEYVRSQKPEVSILLEEVGENIAGQCRKFLSTKYAEVEL